VEEIPQDRSPPKPFLVYRIKFQRIKQYGIPLMFISFTCFFIMNPDNSCYSSICKLLAFHEKSHDHEGRKKAELVFTQTVV
jgi:hypothetical protein